MHKPRRRRAPGLSGLSASSPPSWAKVSDPVPRPRAHQHTYHGVLAPAAPYRDLIVPGRRKATTASATLADRAAAHGLLHGPHLPRRATVKACSGGWNGLPKAWKERTVWVRIRREFAICLPAAPASFGLHREVKSMKLALASLLGLFLVALGPAPAAHSCWPAVTVAGAWPRLRHAESIELLARLRADLLAIQDLTRNMRGLAAVAGNGTLPANERVLLDMQFQQLKGQLDQLALSSSSSGIPLLDGSNRSVALQIQPARPQMWSQPLSECTSITLGLAVTDIATVPNAWSALAACDMALDSIGWGLSWVRAGTNAIGP